MAEFVYHRWSGAKHTVRGVSSVEFGPAHVVFRDENRQVILAERAEHVNELQQTDRAAAVES